MLACTCLREKSIESVISSSNCFVTGHLAIWLDTMLEAEKFPASIANLDAALSKVKAKDLTHCCNRKLERTGSKCPSEMPGAKLVGGPSRNVTDQSP